MADPSPTIDAMNAHLNAEHLRVVVDGGLQEHWSAHGVCISFLCREIDALRLELAEARAEIRVLSGVAVVPVFTSSSGKEPAGFTPGTRQRRSRDSDRPKLREALAKRFPQWDEEELDRQTEFELDNGTQNRWIDR